MPFSRATLNRGSGLTEPARLVHNARGKGERQGQDRRQDPALVACALRVFCDGGSNDDHVLTQQTRTSHANYIHVRSCKHYLHAQRSVIDPSAAVCGCWMFTSNVGPPLVPFLWVGLTKGIPRMESDPLLDR